MKYWTNRDGKMKYKEGDGIDFCMDRLMTVYSKRNELNEEWFNSEMKKLLEKLRKELEA